MNENDNSTNSETNSIKNDESKYEDNCLLIKDQIKEEHIYKDSIWSTLSISFHTILFYISLYSLNSINLSIAGQNFSDDALNAVGLSHFYANCLFLSWTIGAFSGFEVMAPKTYATKKFRLLGTYFHMATIVGNVLMIILFIINCYMCVPIISLFVKDENVLQYVKRYIYVVLIAFYFDGQFSINFKYMNVIGKSYIGSIIIVLSVLLHLILSIIFVKVLKWDIEGLGYSLLIVNLLNSVCGLIYICIIKPLPESIFWFSSDSFSNLKDYLKISIPNTFFMCSQWIGFEIISFIALWVGNVDYTIHVIMHNLWQYSSVLNSAFIITNFIVVGKCIALGDIDSLKKNVLKLYLIGISLISLLFLFFSNGRYFILGIFSKSEEVIEKGSLVLIVLGIMIIFDFTQAFLNSISRSLNRVNLPLIISYTNYFILQIGLTILLGKYLSLGILGIWIGITISSCIIAIIIFFYLNTLDLMQIHHETVLKLNDSNEIKDL